MQARQGVVDHLPSLGLRATESFASSEMLSEMTSDGLGDDSCVTHMADDIVEEQEDESDARRSSGDEGAEEADDAETATHDSDSAARQSALAPDNGLLARCLQVCGCAFCTHIRALYYLEQ